ncbi:MAG: sulfatase-like hydrolase/transferase [Myxococcota bacterium]|nr:sulfatase-like hydrolase/transferase [Myxococcota bacterium]
MRRVHAIVSLLTLSLFGCADRAPALPDVIIVTWDTVRADHVGTSTTPTWNRLAASGRVFSMARTPVPITLPAHASLMTGENPPTHGARDNGTWPVVDGLPTMAERFRAGGWATAAFVSASVLDSRYGIARGFSTYNDHIRPGKNRVVAHRPGTETVDQAIAWLGDRSEDQPVFLWVHLFDPHRPWDASTDPDVTDYAAAIGKADAATARILDVMEARGRLNSSIIALTADHGEGLGEHGEETHGYFAYDSTLHVPMMLWVGPEVGTARATEGREVGGPASLVDLAPTLTVAAGLEPIGSAGINLLDPQHAERLPSRALSFETVTPALDFDTAPIFGVIDATERAMFDLPTPEKYHLDSDPKQLVNRYRDADREAMIQALAAFNRHWPPSTDPMTLSDQEREALESLGYITRSITTFEPSTVDPKDRIDLFNLLTNAPTEPATQLLARADAMIERHGMVPALMLFKADLLDALARPLDALNTVRQAATAHPSDRDLNGEYLNRQRALMDLQRLAEAIEEEREAKPNDPTIERDLAITYHRLQRFDEAETVYRAVLRRQPENDEVRVDLARMFASQQRYDAALGTLAPALRRPSHSPAIDCMAGRLMSRGKQRQAEAERLLSYCESSDSR